LPVSAVDCVQPALQHTRDQLFRPFRFGQWSRLALVGFLAAELNSSGCNFNKFNYPISHPRQENGFMAQSMPFGHFNPQYLAQFAALIIAAAAVAFVLFFVLLYLNSVFRFILFDSVLKKHCSIREGWSRWQRAGRRYFLWRIVLLIAEGVLLGLLIGAPLALAAALGWFQNAGEHLARSIFGVVVLVALFLVFLLMAAVIQVIAKDFLVPIMALDEVDFAEGWSRLLEIMRPEPGKYVVYLLLKIVLGMVAAIAVGIVALVPIFVLVVPAALAVFAGYKAGLTWNVATVSLTIIAGSFMVALLLYIVALISVPTTIFFPAYSIYFFAARYPKLEAVLNPPPALAPSRPIMEPELPELPPASPTNIPPPEPIG
jgi:hypothetical protein